MDASKPLGEILQSRRWSRRLEPFPHVVADEVFIPSVVEELTAAVEKVLADGRGVSHFGWYDALGWTFPPDTDWPLRIFISPEWHDLIAGTMNIDATRHVNAGIHSHAIGSADGFIHHDLNPVYFPHLEGSNGGVQVSRPDLVNYMTGELRGKAPATPRRVVRAVALLYYLGNEEWRPGDGGETGLYGRSSGPVTRAEVTVPPRNNSLMMFECTPNSFHTFRKNTRAVRNSVIMWLHRDYDEAVARWGEESLGLWTANEVRRRPTATV